jgi:beta-lactamase regulating signal transducer with metallopeptidase domain
MRIVLSSALLGLAWFAAINVPATIAAWVIARAAVARGATGPAVLLSIRFLPAAVSSIFVLAVFLPAHLRFEPEEAQESFGVILGGLAAVGAVILLRSAWRAVRAVSMARRVLRAARRSATRVHDEALAVPGLAGVVLAGIIKPQVLIGADALNALTADELDVAISHEIAHGRSRDNLKRFFMFCAPDVFGWMPTARVLEDRWEAEAECQADADAVGGDNGRAIALASALVKVAKLTYRGPLVVAPPAWSAFHVPTLLETRVRRLVAGRAIATARRGRLSVRFALAAIAAPAIVWLTDVSYNLHQVTETMVNRLP